MARLPDGDPAPSDGALPAAALGELAGRPLGVYVHVPFCATRCGYCDFNTYTPTEDGGVDSRVAYVAAARAEIRLAAGVLGPAAPPVSTVFFGGGTPTLLSPAQLGLLVDELRSALPLAPDAEITVEANPETVDERVLGELRGAGFTRVSVGMQSAVAHVLATLERAHDPAAATAAARAARRAGFEHVSLDLIFGAPGERDEDWVASLEAALSAGVDHLSAYGLIVEPGTRMHARVRRGTLPPPDWAVQARRYAVADERLAAAGMRWYELANWAATEGARSRHNLGYWHSANWWGIGPGAHSHVGGVRWWNVLRPRAYGARLASGVSPAAARETLTARQRHVERVLLELRLADGLAATTLDEPGRRAAEGEAAAGRLDAARLAEGRAVLTLDGRLRADDVVAALT